MPQPVCPVMGSLSHTILSLLNALNIPFAAFLSDRQPPRLPSPPSHPCHPSSTTTTTPPFFLYPFRSVSVSLGEGGTDVFLSGWSCLKHSGHLSPTANMLCWTLSLSATHLSPLPSQQRLNQVLKLYLLFSLELGTFFFFLTVPCVNFLFSTPLLPALSVVTCSEQNVKTRRYNVCHTIAKNPNRLCSFVHWHLFFPCWQDCKTFCIFIMLCSGKSLSSLPFLRLMYACDWVRWLNTAW